MKKILIAAMIATTPAQAAPDCPALHAQLIDLAQKFTHEADAIKSATDTYSLQIASPDTTREIMRRAAKAVDLGNTALRVAQLSEFMLEHGRAFEPDARTFKGRRLAL